MYGISVLFSCRVVSYRSTHFYSSDSTKKLLEFLADMPKATSSRIAEAQRQRQQISKKSEKYGPSTVYLQVLGSGARGAPNTLYLFTDQKRYLFNCGECTQRLAHEHKVKLSRLDHIFITSKTWRNIGGLPGLSLTLQDVGVPNITLHGPEGLDELYNATRRFVIMKDMNVTMAKCSNSEDFEDNVMNVKYVLLGPHDNLLTGKDLKSGTRKPKSETNSDKEYEEFSHDDTDYYRPEVRTLEPKAKFVKERERPKVKPVQDRDPQKKKTEKVLHELQKKTHCSVAYICTLKKRLGTLDLAKCVELGVKPGPMLGQLKNGQDVVLPDGSLVLSKDVKTPDDPGPVFIVLDVPDLSYLKEAEFSSHFDNDTNPPENIPTLIVHFTPPHVFHHPTYRSFMAMFGPCTRHLILNHQNSCLGSEAVHRTQHKLHLLDPDIFPLLRDVSVPAVWNAHPPVPKTNSPVRLKGLEELKNKFQNIINLEGSAKGDGHPVAVEECDSVSKLELLAGRTLTMYHLRPKRQLDRTAEPKLHIQDYIQETMDVDGFVGSLEQFRRLVDSMRYAKSDAKEYPKVVFLGTGSCIPSKTRNTSAIVVHVSEDRSILLDCGEGTFGQLVRFYGPKKVNAFLRTLKAIYISHLHADHHIGLIGVIQARRQAIEETGEASPPLYLLAPGQIVTWLTLYDHQFERLRNDYTLIPNQSLLHDHPSQNVDMTSAVLASLGVAGMKTCLVAHCPNAFGVAIDVDDQHKITYSGDTLPCEELVKIGENSTLLIHEATMEDELADEARTKMHSTTTQAIEIGRQMNARYTLLTHFSQRYARLPRLNAHILNDNNSVGIAFDNMQITMSDLELLPHMYAPLQLMFAEHCVEMELKAAQRQRHRERRTSSPSLPPETPMDRQRSESRTRRNAACRAASSAPAPHARYRESNASRLRQEIKGMTITGTVRKPRSRSNSASASPPPPESRKSPARAASRQPSNERPKPKTDQQQPPPTPKEQEKEKPIDMESTPRSMSNTSDFSRDTATSAKISVNSSGYTVDSARSKDTSHPPTAEEVMDIMSNASSKRSSGPPSRTGPIESHEVIRRCGYGKPLVTPVNKKLTIRRDLPWPPVTNPSRDKVTNNIGRTKSPTRAWKAENRESPPPTTPQRPECLRSKIPTKATVSGNKLRASNTSPNVFPDTKIPIMRSNIGARSLRTSVSSLHRSNSRSPTRPPKSAGKNPQDVSSSPTIKMKPAHTVLNGLHDHREVKNHSPDCQKTPPRSPNRGRSPIQAKRTLPELKKPGSPKKALPSQGVRERQKSSVNSDGAAPEMHHSHPVRPNPTGHSNRSFKPQLEDIKSSYLLLNKKPQDLTIKACANSAKKKPHVPRLNPVTEEVRKQQLTEVKQKFQSKHFWIESKYDKIEGLNWISWK
ncbi:zinc phosphodiesterase ELAC protein 2 isoform X2 [Trichoplusia ni]|uniref:Zinc phosphodiesterase ELAC protein 2 n=1 Tax=Trichoplusia ni TaxID=7111 RepID=A0A7E5VAD7_TRINI|nr:zinc phosphodiesterase ELAC protein 2 isoform X2 [Trichoplusia ni]